MLPYYMHRISDIVRCSKQINSFSGAVEGAVVVNIDQTTVIDLVVEANQCILDI